MVNYDKEQVEELEEMNWWFKLNTIFTIVNGVAQLAIAVILLWLGLK